MKAAKKHKSASQIMREFGLKKTFVYKWMKRNNYKDKHRTGRSSVLTTGMKQIISHAGGKRRESNRKVAEKILKKKGVKISYNTVRNYRLEKNYKARKVPSATPITSKNKVDRKKFCSDYYFYSFKDDYFSDEKSFSVTSNPNPRNDYTWIKPGQQLPSRIKVKHPKKVHAFGIVGLKDGKGVKSELYMFETNLDSDLNVVIYKKCLMPFIRTVYGGPTVQRIGKYFTDGDPKHRSNKVLEFLDKNRVKYHSPKLWPGNSPDFNPTEKAWRHMKQYLENIDCKSVRALKQKMKLAWNSILPGHIEKWFAELKKRIIETYDNDGAWVGTWDY